MPLGRVNEVKSGNLTDSSLGLQPPPPSAPPALPLPPSSAYPAPQRTSEEVQKRNLLSPQGASEDLWVATASAEV